jgi:hypothetical protein
MNRPQFTRRRFLATLGAGLLAAPLRLTAGGMQDAASSELFLTASDNEQGRHFVSGFDGEGRKRFQIPTEVRLHSLTVHPTQPGVAVAFARRAGTLAYAFDFVTGEQRALIQSRLDRHFYGHGQYSADGRYLFTTENDYEQGRGVIGVRDGSDYRLLGEMPSYGIGPHDIHLLSDGTTLVVAIGGIRTHPDSGRSKLNLSDMKPSLAYIDSRDGKLLGQYFLQNHKLSIRHLAVSTDDVVGIGLQYQGPPTDRVPLVGVHHGDSEIVLIEAPDDVLGQMQQYVASICIESHRGIAGVTCPRGNVVTFWDIRNHRFLKSLAIRDAAGIGLSSNRREFVITTGQGEIFRVASGSLTPASQGPVRVQATRWDNHLVAVYPPA